MTENRGTIGRGDFPVTVLQIIQENNISQLVVTDGPLVAGFIHLHDLLKEGIV
jgi:arabinose-5-phosphate isomerase